MSNKKYGDILKELRLRIVNGHFPPGGSIPIRSELQREFDTSNQTIQMAMNSLKADGFIVTIGSGGTFVADNPPHLCNYGFASPIRFSDSRFISTMQQSALKLQEEGDFKFSFYFYEQAHIQSEGYRKLIEDVENHRLAGLIFPFPPEGLWDKPILKEKGLPFVVNSNTSGERMPQIAFSHRIFLEKATDYLVAQGRKRIAQIGSWNGREEMESDISYLVKRGLSTPMLTQNCAARYPFAAHQAALIMMGLPAKDRPDAVIIRDDHLVEPATEALAKSGLRIPQDLTLVAHCNFPDRPVSCVPVTRLGLDCLDLIRRDIECLEAQRNGEKVSKFTEVPAVFESELSTTKTQRHEGVSDYSLVAGRRVSVASLP
jgi:DNA-binding LacI/PurR family transcriptional regulator